MVQAKGKDGHQPDSKILSDMDLFQALWHLLNFLAPPLCVAALLVGLVKGWVWRRLLAGVAWRRLWAECALLGLLGQVGALVLLGVEGKLLGYAAWVGLLSLPLAWRLLRAA
jgi:hypothetical protein